jgi:hypothetical protein
MIHDKFELENRRSLYDLREGWELSLCLQENKHRESVNHEPLLPCRRQLGDRGARNLKLFDSKAHGEHV